MSDRIEEAFNQNIETIYQIRIKGHLEKQWSDWFDGMKITLKDNGETLLTGTITDQSQLHGLLKKIRDLGMPLISIIDISSDENKHKQ